MIRVKIAGTDQYATFPDGMSRDEMQAALMKHPAVIKMREQAQVSEPGEKVTDRASETIDEPKGMFARTPEDKRRYEMLRKSLEEQSTPGGELMDLLGGVATTGENIAHTILGPLLGKRMPKRQEFGRPGVLHEIGKFAPFGAAAAPLAGTAGLSGALADILGQGVMAGAAESVEPKTTPLRIALSALLGGGLTSAAHGLGAIGKKVFPSLDPALAATELSPEQVAENIRLAKGTETPLGQILQNEDLHHYFQNKLLKDSSTKAPLSVKNVEKELTRRGKNLFSTHFDIENPEDYASNLIQSLHDSFKKHRDIKNAAYNKVNKIADKFEFKPKLDKFQNKLREYIEPILANNIFEFEPSTNSLLKQLSKGTNQKPLSLSEANIMSRKLKDKAKMLSRNPAFLDRAKVIGDLGNLLKEDVKESVAKSEIPELVNEFKNAEKTYADKYSSFLDNTIYDYLSGKKTDEQLSKQLFQLMKDKKRPKDFESVIKHIPKEGRKNLLYSYFSDALNEDGDLIPRRLSTLLNKLPKQQLKSLVDNPDIINNLRDYVKLHKLNPDAFNLLHNPPTGQKLADKAMQMTQDVVQGHAIGGTAGAIAKLGHRFLRNKSLAKLMTDENFRNTVLQRVKNENPKLVPIIAKAMNYPAQVGLRTIEKGQPEDGI